MTIILSISLLSSCAIHRPVSVNLIVPIKSYKYMFITETSSLSSGTGAVYGDNMGGVYGGMTSKSVNPSDVISGMLMKEGFIRIPALNEELTDETLIISYGESGKRNVAGGLGGYTLEITLQFLSAKNHELIGTCTAEGQGSTEADDIRKAIRRCLNKVLAQ